MVARYLQPKFEIGKPILTAPMKIPPPLLLRYVVEIIVVVITITTLLWPHKISNRPLYPSDMVSALSLKAEAGDAEYLAVQNAPQFKLVIDANVAEVGGKLSALELIEQKPVLQPDRAKGFPHRYTKTIGIKFLAQDFGKGCPIILVLNDSIKSRVSQCSKSDGFLTFNFDETIFPGAYEAVFKSDTFDVDQLDPESFADTNGVRWLFPFRGDSNSSSIELLYAWTIGEPYKAVLFLGLGLILLALGCSKKWNYAHFILIFLLLYSSNILITKALSGHDETAHIEMLYRSIHGVKVPGAEVDQTQLFTFYNNVVSQYVCRGKNIYNRESNLNPPAWQSHHGKYLNSTQCHA